MVTTRAEKTAGLLGLAVGLGGCAAPQHATWSELRARAAFDLHCPAHQLSLRDFAPQSKGIVGCGRQVVYLERCDAASGRCSWSKDGPPEVIPPGSPIGGRARSYNNPAAAARGMGLGTQRPAGRRRPGAKNWGY